MRERDLDALIAQSLKAFGTPEPPDEPPHRFSPAFERRMRSVLGGTSPPRRFRIRRIWYVMIAALLALLAMTMTCAVATRSHRVNTFADRIGYQALGGEAEQLQPTLSYDLTALTERFSEGVEIHCGEQLTRFFRDAGTGEFVEFSSYPKMVFRYHLSLPDTTPEKLDLNGGEALWFADQGGIGYLLWETPSAVIVLRSDLERDELCGLAEKIQVFEE